MRLPLLIASVLALAACAAPDAPSTGQGIAGQANASTNQLQVPNASSNATPQRGMPRPVAGLADNGRLLAYTGAAPIQRSAYVWHQVALSEAHAMGSIVSGTLELQAPDGTPIRLRYDHHVEHANGDWTWIGRPEGAKPGTEAIITFGEKAVFGTIPNGRKPPLRGELGAQIERLITARGYRVEVASSVAEAVNVLNQGGDLRMVISTTHLPDRPVLELVDVIRRHPFGLRIPIFIYGPEDDSTYAATEQQRWEAPVIHVELPASVAGWGMVLEPILNLPLGKLQGLEPLTAVQRFAFRRQAMSAIGHLSSHPEIYHFYDFRLVAAASLEVGPIETGEAGNVAFGDPRLAVLSVAASGESQAALVDLLLQTAATPDRYQAVSEALRQSLARNGILISGAVLRRLDAAVLQTAEGPQRRAIMDVIETISARVGVGSAEGEE